MRLARPRPMLVLLFSLAVAIIALVAVATSSSARSEIKDGHGRLTVETSPAVASQVAVDGIQRNISLVRGLELPAGSYTVCFDHIDGYLPPPCERIDLAAGQTLTHVGTFQPSGLLTVRTRYANGTIVIDGIDRDRGSVTLPVSAGEREICFGAVGGYDAPACEAVTVSHQGTTSIVGTYVASASDLVVDAGTNVGEDPVDQLEPQPAPPVEGSGGAGSGVPPEAGDGGATVPEEGDVADIPRGSLQDVPAGVHRDAILRMVDQGIIQGHADGTFRPASSVTRGQVAALLSRAFHLKGPACDEDCLALSDIDASTHAKAIRAVVAAGIASGYHDRTFGPERAVTREQIAAMLAATLELSGDGLEHPFDDIRGTTHEASIAALYHAGITQGSGPTTFSPREPMRRDQYASLLDRSLAGS